MMKYFATYRQNSLSTSPQQAIPYTARAETACLQSRLSSYLSFPAPQGLPISPVCAFLNGILFQRGVLVVSSAGSDHL